MCWPNSVCVLELHQWGKHSKQVKLMCTLLDWCVMLHFAGIYNSLLVAMWNTRALYSDRRLGGWSEEGVSILNNQLERNSVTCSITHLSSFAVLVDVAGQSPVSDIRRFICMHVRACSHFKQCICGIILYVYVRALSFLLFAVIYLQLLVYYICTQLCTVFVPSYNVQAYTTLAYRLVSYIGCAISLLCLIATIIFLVTLRYVCRVELQCVQ